MDYYARTGYPQGRWLGSGLVGLSLDSPTPIRAGDAVTEEQLAYLFGAGRHPVTGSRLGAAPRVESSRAVSGFDLTFTVPKSASVLWGLAGEATRSAVADAHAAAVSDVLGLIEDRALFTRTGPQGAMQVPTRGLLAAGFDHWDTRQGDPNLHTHVIIANRVQGPDGRWRTIDSRALHQAAVALSEMFDDVFADHLAARLPVRWGFRSRGADRTPAFEVTGLGDDLLAAFSTRSVSITAELARLRAVFHADHGRAPTRTEVVKLRQQATLATRPAKTPTPLGVLVDRWANTARRVTGRHPRQITAEVLAADPARRVRADQLRATTVTRLAGMVCDGLVGRRAVFTEWNMWAETARATRGLRMTSLAERVTLVERVVTMVKAACVPLDPPSPAHLLAQLRRADGASVYSRAGEAKYAHPALIAAERVLLAGHANATAPTIPAPALQVGLTHVARVRPSPSWAARLAPDQAAAVREVASSGRQVDVLVGPAGAGKTTTLAALAALWQQTHGAGTVIGLAPSATAAQQLGAALGIHTENTTKWLHESQGPGAEHRAATLGELAARRTHAVAACDFGALRRIDATAQQLHTQQQEWQLRPGQLLIVDEATLAGTLDLAALAGQADSVGAKVLLVGDHTQLGAVAAGGGFGMLARTGQPTQLHSLWRFTHGWEAQATLGLRTGDPTVIDTYTAHGRVHTGTPPDMLDAAYTAWAADRAAGLTSIMVAADHATVTELNTRAHDHAVATGQVTGAEIPLGGHCGDRGQVGRGDTIVTRRNDRHLRLPGGVHVRNGTLWQVTATHGDGALTVRPEAGGPGTLRLPAIYVSAHVDLGYATTAHRAQGITVDTSHTLADPTTSREALYVAMTRGRNANHAYLAPTADEAGCHPNPARSTHPTTHEMLAGILTNSQAELSATETLTRAHTPTGTATEQATATEVPFDLWPSPGHAHPPAPGPTDPGPNAPPPAHTGAAHAGRSTREHRHAMGRSIA